MAATPAAADSTQTTTKTEGRDLTAGGTPPSSPHGEPTREICPCGVGADPVIDSILLFLPSRFGAAEIKEQIAELNASVASKESRHAARAVRKFLTKTRKHVDRNVLTSIFEEFLVGDHAPLKDQLGAYVSKVSAVLRERVSAAMARCAHVALTDLVCVFCVWLSCRS